MPHTPVKLIAIDMDGTLVGRDGEVSARNRAALAAAQAAGIVIVIATGRRHTYALRVLRELGLPPSTPLVSSNGAVVRLLDATLVERSEMPLETAKWLCRHAGEFRDTLMITFDRMGPDGEDRRGTLVVEEMDALNLSLGRWMASNAPYIEHIRPLEDALVDDAPIQMMLCGTVERMRRAEAHLLTDPRVRPVGDAGLEGCISLNRTDTPERDLSIVDILPIGCAKGAAIQRLAESAGISMSEVMAIGDNWNDLSMLELAGHPVLMGNAPEDLISQAEALGFRVAPAHHLDGVAEVIEAVLDTQTAPAVSLRGD